MTPVILGRIIGLSFFIFSFVLIFNQNLLKLYLKLLYSKEFLLISGSFFLFLGIIIISIHNAWNFSWEIIITISGWALIIEGLFRICFIEIIPTTINWLNQIKVIKLSLWLTLFVGLYLILITL